MQLKKREIPYEVMFKLSDAKQDPIKKNRYWFDFPSQWADQYNKDPIIGIKDIYLTKTNRIIQYDFKIHIIEEGANESVKLWLTRSGTLVYTLDGEDTIKDFTTKFSNYWKAQTKETYQAEDYSALKNGNDVYDWNEKDLAAWFEYDSTSNKCLLHIGCSNVCPESLTVVDTNNQTHTVKFKFEIRSVNEDTNVVLGTNVLKSGLKEVVLPIWTRYGVYITSSLAEDDVNGFLGHSRPLGFNHTKYYRLKNTCKKFWIELYEVRYNKVPVDVLPNDSRDDLFIEAIVCFSSEGMF
ncbi:hypothetical protein IKN40_00275 [bacterium]|nr:hypothetical protein [bacterium]